MDFGFSHAFLRLDLVEAVKPGDQRVGVGSEVLKVISEDFSKEHELCSTYSLDHEFSIT
jgi:hypothetical protein